MNQKSGNLAEIRDTGLAAGESELIGGTEHLTARRSGQHFFVR
jgi:hypothetical protein